MSLLTRRLRHCRLDRHVIQYQTGYEKTIPCSIRRFRTPQSQPHKSTATSPVKTAPSKTNAITSKLTTAAPTNAAPIAAAATTSVATANLNAALNPPSTARPPVLTLPEKNSTDPIYKYYFNLGKAYLNFYKTGLKGIYTNYKTAAALPDRRFHPLFVSRRTLYAAAADQSLSRAELRLLLRLRADAKVLPFFALVFICCGEFTPLLVPWLTAIVPPSVHLPSQTKTLRVKAEKRRQQARAEGPPEWRNIRNIWDLKPPEFTDNLLPPMFRRLAVELALHPPWWEKFPLFMPFVRGRLGWRLSDLKYDDMTIIRDGGVKEMILEEVTMACERRGLAVEGKEEEKLREWLEEWLKNRNSDSAQELVDWLTGKMGLEGRK